MNIVKFHGYWQDRTKSDDRPRVSHSSMLRLGTSRNASIPGRLHHGVHVQWIVEALPTQSEEDQTAPIEEFLATLVYSVALRAEVRMLHVNCRVTHSFLFSYLHSCDEPIIHGNLTCDTIFIQNNGLVKIGSSKSTGRTRSFRLPMTKECPRAKPTFYISMSSSLSSVESLR